MVSRDRRSTPSDHTPMLARWGTGHPSAPLVVALHGNGTSEHSIIEIAPWLPHGPVAYVAVRAPIEGDTGFIWFDDGGDGLAATCRWLLDWLDTEGDPDRPVLLLGFRDGVTVAGAMMLAAPHRFSGAVLLYGSLPDDAVTATTRGRLCGMPVFLAHGTGDTRTPADRLARILRDVHAGGRYVDSEIAATALTEGTCPLSDRELDVLRHVRDGASATVIAERVHLAPGTVRNYVSSAMTKLNAPTRAEAARIAYEEGWI